VHPNIAEKRVGETNIKLFSWHCPGDDESIHPIVTSIVDTTVLSIVNGAIAGPPDPSRTIRELWGSLEESNGEGGLYAHNVTPIYNNHTAAGCVKAAMKLSNQMLVCIVYRGQQAEDTDRALMPMRGGHS
jgi:hypothetical protein